MKKLMIAVLVAAMSTTAMAKTGEKNAKVNVEIDRSQVNLIYSDVEASNVLVSMTNSKGKRVKKDFVKNSDGFVRSYDLSALQTDVYTIQFSNEDGLFYETTVLVNNSSSAVKPTGQDKYQLTFEEPGIQMVNVKIYNADGTVIHRESLESSGGFSRVYDLSKFKQRGFSFRVSSENKVETHKI